MIKDINLLDKKRFEAFVDAIFAIVITFLVLEFKVPHIEHATDKDLKESLLEMLPLYGCYILSFFTIMVIWLDHHHLFKFIDNVPKKYALLNFIFLLAISSLPFATGFAGEYNQSKFAMVFFLTTLLIVNSIFSLLFVYSIKNKLISDENLSAFGKGKTIAMIGLALEAISIPLVFIHPYFGFVMAFIVLGLHLSKIYINYTK